jgi:hypothetical protein
VGTARRRATLLINSQADLARALAGEMPRRVTIDDALLPAGEAAEWRGTLNRHLADCGCGQASFALLLAVIALTGLIVFVPVGSWWMRAVVLVLGSSAVMAAAKSLALRRAERRYRTALAALLARLERGGNASG